MRTLVLALACALLGVGGCAFTPGPVVVSREALGTVVTVTAYGDDEAAVNGAIEDAFAAMAEAYGALNAYDPGSPIAAMNASPGAGLAMPEEALEVIGTVDRLGVADSFSVTLGSVVALYGFESSRMVPTEEALRLALDASGAAPQYDFGGAAKGLALDEAREALRASGAVTAAVLTAGSTTVTFGSKPDGETWQIGVEDPRSIGRVIAVFELVGEGAVSTSGDYQLFFERDGVRYHHILDPATGKPARGVRSLAVGGSELTGLDSDVLSTALFVAGPAEAIAYAREHDISLYVVENPGSSRLIASATAALREVADPTR